MNRFIVLRASGDKLQTLGPMAEPLGSFLEADREAQRLAGSTSGHGYVVAEVIAEYTQQPSVVVKMVNTGTVTELKRKP